MYYQEYFAFRDRTPIKAVIRHYTKPDFEALLAVQKECFPPPFPEELWWNEEQLTNHVEMFPDGAFCVEIDGEIVGSMTALIVNYSHGDKHSWEEITDNGYIRNHNPNGNTLYVVDISVKPAFRKLGIGKKLMQAMYETVIELNLDRLLGGGRMPGYHKHAAELSPEQYLDKVITGELNDPVTTFLMRVGRVPVDVVHNYLDDEESGNCAALMEWKNPFKNS
ncbi:GNAT family N-acetyltransferase [Domibacillus epiphyticus]|uniref:GNAT family N-acetyltransferase n=1 Tax=Domibacillus epiphyticus TaxID=1714355 RepID=A0A1V2A533_9BACI|nr:GNAT family N-acetyltransferase [Domibacillus epiphyticus]OMP66086.1 GNAT family N-acetyltransferase [Domibacillus epiphyticus]